MATDLRPERPARTSLANISALAKKFSDQQMYAEAIHLYEMATRLDPASLALKMNLARARKLKEADDVRHHEEIRETVRAELRREEIDASHYMALGEHYLEKENYAKAIEYLEVAKLKSPHNYLPYKFAGLLYFNQGDFENAKIEIDSARGFNPFDRGACELAGKIEYELGNFREALQAWIDCFLLAGNPKGEVAEKARRAIHTVKRFLKLENKSLNQHIKERVEALQSASERLELSKEKLFRYNNPRTLHDLVLKKTRATEKRENLIALSSMLRKMEMLLHIRDERLFKLSRVMRLRSYEASDVIFTEGDASKDIYLIHQGRVVIKKETPFGPQELAVLGKEDIFGEMNFLDRAERSSDAVASEPTQIFVLNHGNLEALIEEDKEVAVDLYWTFWKSLSKKVRNANELLKTFFSQDVEKVRHYKIEHEAIGTERVSVEVERKLDLFDERGLSAGEMKLLATFSEEERMESGGSIFKEGDAGEKLYIILDGRVRISKFIPGVGEEALAILNRGDFFGEMALIDNEPRSADARAHDGPVTVLSIDRKTLGEVLSMDPAASLQFLNMLCGLLTGRLREINEKIVQWKYMTGGF